MKRFERIDRSGMLDLLCDFPSQCERALYIEPGRSVVAGYARKRFKGVIFTGMGGSAIAGDIARSIAVNTCSIPVMTSRDYVIPDSTDRDFLVFALSYSGNTEETINAYKMARSRSAKIVVVTSGGRLEALAYKNGDALIKIPPGLPPRCALGYMLIPSLTALSILGIIPDCRAALEKTIAHLGNLLKSDLDPGSKNNRAVRLAGELYGRMPVVYASSGYMGPVAYRWKCQFNENAKVFAHYELFPELDHNEIVAWDNPAGLVNKFSCVNLITTDMPSRMQRRMSLTGRLLRRSGFRVTDVKINGVSQLCRILGGVYLGDFVSFYLAMKYGVDPTPVNRIEGLKKEIARSKA